VGNVDKNGNVDKTNPKSEKYSPRNLTMAILKSKKRNCRIRII